VHIFNARSVVNEISESHLLLQLIATTYTLLREAWLHDGIYSGLFDPYSEFTVLRKDRANGRGGGVCVCVCQETLTDYASHL